MTRDKIKSTIQNIVEQKQGCKVTELIADIPNEVFNEISSDDFFPILNELIEDKKLIQISYVLPNLDYRIKDFLLPGGTRLIQTPSKMGE